MMRIGWTGFSAVVFAVTLAGSVALTAQGPAPAGGRQGAAAPPAGRQGGAAPAPGRQGGAAQVGGRTGDGKPNLNGVWQALTSANWDIESHEAEPGPHPEI